MASFFVDSVFFVAVDFDADFDGFAVFFEREVRARKWFGDCDETFFFDGFFDLVDSGDRRVEFFDIFAGDFAGFQGNFLDRADFSFEFAADDDDGISGAQFSHFFTRLNDFFGHVGDEPVAKIAKFAGDGPENSFADGRSFTFVVDGDEDCRVVAEADVAAVGAPDFFAGADDDGCGDFSFFDGGARRSVFDRDFDFVADRNSFGGGTFEESEDFSSFGAGVVDDGDDRFVLQHWMKLV